MSGSSDSSRGFEILGELGRGTTGIAYAARDTRLNRRVVVKTLHLEAADPWAVRAERFWQECEALKHLTAGSPPRIPTLHLFAYHEERPLYIREFVDGDNFEQRVAAGLLDLRAGLAVIASVAHAVQRVHEQGFVHRNLSAANVLVAPDGTAWLIGFGRVGPLAGSELAPPAGGAATSTEVDIHGLQDLLRWLLYQALSQPIPPGLWHLLAPGTVPTAGAFGEALTRCL